MFFLFLNLTLAGIYFFKPKNNQPVNSSKIYLDNSLGNKLALDEQKTDKLLQEVGLTNQGVSQPKISLILSLVDKQPKGIISSFRVNGRFAYGFGTDRDQDNLDVYLYFDKQFFQKEPSNQKEIIKNALLKAFIYLGKVKKANRRLTTEEQKKVYSNFSDLSAKYDFIKF